MATRTTPKGRDVYVPADGGFIADLDGSPVQFHENIRVSKAWLDEHPQWAHLFRQITVHYDVEEATARPGEARA
jgi:hypothetical protein